MFGSFIMDDEKEKDSKKKSDKISSVWEKSLFESRTVLLFGEITMELAQKISAQLLAFSAHDKTKPIKLIINSPGGHAESGYTIHDMIKFVECPIQVIGSGCVASAAAIIFLGAKKENRFALNNTRFLLHQPISTGMRGFAEDIKIHAEEIIKMKERINQMIAFETNNPVEKVRKDTERDYWLSVDEAKSYGMLHKVITSIKELP